MLNAKCYENEKAVAAEYPKVGNSPRRLKTIARLTNS